MRPAIPRARRIPPPGPVMPVERAVGVQKPDFLIHTERSGNVLNGRFWNLLDGQESTDCLRDL